MWTLVLKDVNQQVSCNSSSVFLCQPPQPLSQLLMWTECRCIMLKNATVCSICPSWTCQFPYPTTWKIMSASSLQAGPGLCEPTFLAWIYQCDFLPLLPLSSFLPTTPRPEVNIICRTFDMICHGRENLNKSQVEGKPWKLVSLFCWGRSRLFLKGR